MDQQRPPGLLATLISSLLRTVYYKPTKAEPKVQDQFVNMLHFGAIASGTKYTPSSMPRRERRAACCAMAPMWSKWPWLSKTTRYFDDFIFNLLNILLTATHPQCLLSYSCYVVHHLVQRRVASFIRTKWR